MKHYTLNSAYLLFFSLIGVAVQQKRHFACLENKSSQPRDDSYLICRFTNPQKQQQLVCRTLCGSLYFRAAPERSRAQRGCRGCQRWMRQIILHTVHSEWTRIQRGRRFVTQNGKRRHQTSLQEGGDSAHNQNSGRFLPSNTVKTQKGRRNASVERLWFKLNVWR